MSDKNLYQVHVDGRFVVNVWADDSRAAIRAAKAQSGRSGKAWNAVRCSMEYYANVLQRAGFGIVRAGA